MALIDTFMGLPAHPFLVHAAVVFGPLLVAAVFVYSLIPSLRSRMGWVVVALAVIAPLSLWLARLSGERFLAKQRAAGAPAKQIDKILNHSHFGNWASWTGLALGVLALLLVLVGTAAGRKPQTPGSRTLTYTVIVVTLIVAVATGYYVYKTGDSGARMVWT
jgi:Predicted membrane protein (DUF2231)